MRWRWSGEELLGKARALEACFWWWCILCSPILIHIPLEASIYPSAPTPTPRHLQTHSCYKKAAMILGLDHVRVLPTSEATSWAIRSQDLEAAISEDLAKGLIPFFVCATIGTTSSCAVDPIPQLGEVCGR